MNQKLIEKEVLDLLLEIMKLIFCTELQAIHR